MFKNNMFKNNMFKNNMFKNKFNKLLEYLNNNENILSSIKNIYLYIDKKIYLYSNINKFYILINIVLSLLSSGLLILFYFKKYYILLYSIFGMSVFINIINILVFIFNIKNKYISLFEILDLLNNEISTINITHDTIDKLDKINLSINNISSRYPLSSYQILNINSSDNNDLEIESLKQRITKLYDELAVAYEVNNRLSVKNNELHYNRKYLIKSNDDLTEDNNTLKEINKILYNEVNELSKINELLGKNLKKIENEISNDEILIIN